MILRLLRRAFCRFFGHSPSTIDFCDGQFIQGCEVCDSVEVRQAEVSSRTHLAELCDRCEGDGWEFTDGGWRRCRWCGGSGRRIRSMYSNESAVAIEGE